MNLDTTNDIGKLILRFALGILILLHGIAKLTGGIDPAAAMLQGIGLPTTMAVGVYISEIVDPIFSHLEMPNFQAWNSARRARPTSTISKAAFRREYATNL